MVQIKTPIKSIRAKCLDCCADSSHEVKLCECVSCSLWAYRFGRRPSHEERKTIKECEIGSYLSGLGEKQQVSSGGEV